MARAWWTPKLKKNLNVFISLRGKSIPEGRADAWTSKFTFLYILISKYGTLTVGWKIGHGRELLASFATCWALWALINNKLAHFSQISNLSLLLLSVMEQRSHLLSLLMCCRCGLGVLRGQNSCCVCQRKTRDRWSVGFWNETGLFPAFACQICL